MPFPLREPDVAPHTPRQGWSEQFAKAAQNDDLNQEWLNAPLTDWDNTKWEW